MNKPAVSIVIPTYNSEKTLGLCLKSVREQSYPGIEVVVVDSYSKDCTRRIADEFDVRIKVTKNKLLGARYEGLKESNGEYVLLLDADQILNKSAIARSLQMFGNYDMLCLEENSYEPRTWIQKLFEADRRLINSLACTQIDPLDGALLARFYKREVLEKAFENISAQLMPIVVAHDHAIIYFEAFKVSNSVGIIPNSVWHMEPNSLNHLWRKNFRYGKTTKELAKTGFYSDLLKRKVRFRKGCVTRVNLRYCIQSYLLLSFKGFAYQMGYWSH